MSTKIRHKRSSVPGKKPIVSQLESGELAINTADGKVFLLRDDNTVQDLTQRIFENNSQVIVSDATDSSQGTVTVTVDGSDKMIVSNSTIDLMENVEIEDGNSITFKELTASGTDGVSVKAPDTMLSSYTLTLPPNAGTAGGIMRVDGSGNLYFGEADIYGGFTIYVSADKGDDLNDGQNLPVKTVKRACQIASGIVYDVNGLPNGIRVNIKVAVGDYVEQNPIIVPDNTVIKGDGLRGCIIRPANANLDMLRVRNACYFSEFTFRDNVDANFVPLFTWNYAVAFDDPDDVSTSRVGYTNLPSTRPTITTSPYVQNASIISFLGGSGAKIDGSKVNSPNIPLTQIEVENPVAGPAPEQGKSMVANAFTMLSFGGTGWRLTNDAYAQIVSCFQIFLLNGVYTQSGGYCSITNSATNFGLYALRSSGYSLRSFSFDRAFVTGTGVSGGKQTISIVGINRDAPVEEFVIRFRDPEYKYAYDLIESEKNSIADDTIDWMNAQIAAATPGNIWYNFTFNTTTFRTTLLVILDAIAQDTWSTGNALTRQTALSFYSNRLADSSFITISGQEEQTIAALEQASVYTATVIASLDSTVKAFVDEKFDLVKEAIADPASIPEAVEVTSTGDLSNDFKDPATETTFNAATDINVTTNIFTIINHGFTNLQKVIYNSNGNPEIVGLDNEQTYYVNVINNDEFTLSFDESGDFRVNILSLSTGTHKLLSNIREFFIEEVLSSHQVYQKLILESGAENYEFVPGRQITGTTGGNNNSAIVYSWRPVDRELVVSIELVTVGQSTVRNQFSSGSVIATDHSFVPVTTISVNEVSPVTNLGTATFTVQPTVNGALLTNLSNLPEKQIWFHRPSIVNSSGHTWEYAGSGTDYNALPQNGGNTRVEYEQFAELPGRVYSSGTNELGDFKVGDFITAFNRTGNITFRNKVTVDELDVLRLAFSDIVIEEISTSVNLGDDELGGPSDSRLSTQLSIRSFLSNRLGGFIDKTVSTAAVPGAIVQLNTNGQLNPDLIPATRQFTSTTTEGYLSRLQQVDEIPAVDLKAGDIATEEFTQVEITLDSPISANDGDIITQPSSNVIGYVRGNFTNSTNILIGSIGATFDGPGDLVGSIYINGVDTGAVPTDLGTQTAFTENFFLKSSNTSQFLVLSNDDSYTFTSTTITNVARSANVATITTSTNHGLVAGVNVQVICTSDETFTVNGRVVSVTPNTFTINNTGSTVTSTAGTGTVRTIVTSADGNAQGAVTETRYGVLTNVDNANITGGSGYLPTTGSQVYEFIPLITLTGSGSGAYADVTVTAGQITDVDIRRGGVGYEVGDLITIDSTDFSDSTTDPSTGSSFVIEANAIENRAYVNILGGELFVASASSVDFIEDNTAPSTVITITLTDTVSKNFLAGDVGAGGAVNYTTYRISITGHGFESGDPVTYNTLGNVAIGGLLNNDVYYVKKIDNDTIELYDDYSLLNLIEFTSTPANNNHNLTRYQVNITDNSIIVPAHGLATGDAIRIEGSTLFEINGDAINSGSRFFIGSVTTNSFTLHELRSEALASINGLVTGAKDITAIGTGTADVYNVNAKVVSVVNTSSRLKANWNSLAVTNIDASNIISGTISPSRLASSGTANTDTFLRGDSSYQVVVQKLKKADTIDNPITLTGSNVAGEFYGDPVTIGIENVDFALNESYSTLGVSKFLQTQFDVASDGSGQVFIKDGVVDAGTLDGLDSSYFLNPANLTSPVPVNKGGTNLSTYAVGDILYAQSSGTLNTLNIGRRNTFLKSNGTVPEWGTALDLAEGLDVGSATLTSSSTGIGQVYNTNVTSLELGSNAENVKIGRSTATRDITSFATGYDATISRTVTVNLASFTRTSGTLVLTGSKEIPMASTTGILYGMVITGSASIPANTIVTGVTTDYIYINNAITGSILGSTTLTFTYTPLTLGIRAGDTINIVSSGITNLDGSWPVLGATSNATSFTIQTDANVTANPANPIAGTLTKDNTILIRNRNVIFGSAEASATPIATVIKGENGIGTNIAGAALTIRAGVGTGNAAGGSLIFQTGQVGTSGVIEQTPTTRLTIDTSGTATFSGIITASNTIQANSANGITTNQGTFPLINTTATNVSFAGAATTLTIGATTGTATIRNATVTLSGDLNVNGGDIATTATTFNLLNATATTVNAFGAGTTISIGAGTGNTTVNNNLVVTGNLTVNGTTTTVNTEQIDVEDKNITLGNVVSPTDVTADAGGITLKGATDKTLNWLSATGSWTSSENFNLLTGKTYKINGSDVLSATSLGSGVTSSSLTTVGTIGTGIWQGTIIDPTYGGTGVNNGSNTITLGGNFTTSGAFTTTLTVTGNTNVTLPTSGTLAITGGTLAQFASTTSSQLAGVISDETGSGSLVFGTSPSFTTSVTTGSTTFSVFNTTATTVNAFGAATTLGIGNTATAAQTVNMFTASTGASTYNFATGATANLTTKTLNIGTGGAAGSTTNVNIGSSVGGTVTVNSGTIVGALSSQNVFNSVATTVNAFGAATTLGIGATSGTMTLNNPTIVGSQTTQNLFNTVATTVNFAGAATTLSIGAATGTATINNETVVITNDLEVRGDLNTNQTTFNLLNTTATTVNAFGAGTTISIGAATGTLTVNNANVVVAGDLEVRGGDLTTNQTTFNLLNTTATTVNFAGAATDVQIGAATGTTNVNNNLDVDGTVNVDGNALTTSQASFSLLNTTATTVNAFGAATALSIGSATGTTTINNANVVVTGDLAVNGADITTSTTGTSTIFNANTTTINLGQAATTISMGATTGTTTVRNSLAVNGNTTLGDASADTVTINANTISVPNTITVGVDDAVTNNISYPIRLRHTTTGTPANGIGTGIQFITETTANNNEIGATIDAVVSDVTATSEDFYLSFKTMAAGATAAERMRVDSGIVTLTDTAPILSFFAADSTYSLRRSSTAMTLDSSGTTVVASATGTALQTRNGSITFATGAGAGLTTHMTIDSSGNVGIGTAPAAKLHVDGAIRVDSTYNLDSATASLSTVTQTVIANIPLVTFGSGKLLIQAYDTVSGERHITELFVVHDGVTALATEYATVFTGAAKLATYEVDINGGNVRVLATGASVNTTQYKIAQTLMLA